MPFPFLNAKVYPPFTGGSMFNQKTYMGRVRHFFDVIDPTTLFVSKKKLAEARALLADHQARMDGGLGYAPGVTDEMLWKAQKLKVAIIHPQTDENILLPFRMSSFVPMNFPIALGMFNCTSRAGQLFWQWYNQSYNVGVNYANRNASNELKWNKILSAYGYAVGLSCLLVLGLNAAVRRASIFSALTRTVIRKLVPFVAVASAGAANVALMRSNEIYAGITVETDDGEPLGVSKKAGARAVAQVAASRVVLPAPILLFPPLAMAVLEKRGLITSPRVRMGYDLALITCFVWGALPFAIGMFPQRASVHVSKLEPHFHNIRDSQDLPIDLVYYNKGL